MNTKHNIGIISIIIKTSTQYYGSTIQLSHECTIFDLIIYAFKNKLYLLIIKVLIAKHF